MNEEIRCFVTKQLNNKLNKIRDEVFLRDEDISILVKYKIPYLECEDMASILYLIEKELEAIDDSDELEELDDLSARISEFYYYNMSHK